MSLTALQTGKILCEASGWEFSNLRVQKIAYLAHMRWMVDQGSPSCPLISDVFQAWDYGPVLPSLYRHVKAFGSKPIENVFRLVDTSQVGTDERQLLKDAARFFRTKSPGYLVNATHKPLGAWARHYQPGRRSIEIPNADIYAEGEALYGHRSGAQ